MEDSNSAEENDNRARDSSPPVESNHAEDSHSSLHKLARNLLAVNMRYPRLPVRGGSIRLRYYHWTRPVYSASSLRVAVVRTKEPLAERCTVRLAASVSAAAVPALATHLPTRQPTPPKLEGFSLASQPKAGGC